MGGPPLPRSLGMGMQHIIMEGLAPFSKYEIFKNRLINAPHTKGRIPNLAKVLQCGTNQLNMPVRFVKPFLIFL